MAPACSGSAPSLARVAPTLLLLLLCFAACRCRAAPPGALVTHLPGFDGAQLPSNHYAGYVTVDEKLESRLFYYLVESERDPANDPLVLWLNGGPGCSSFDGFVYEHGASSITCNVSSVIYLDSPVGVGLSYAKDKFTAYKTGDLKTAKDSHTFLLKGYIVGNGVCDTAFDGNALVPFAHGMGLISDDMYKETSTACQGNYWNDSSSYNCSMALSKVNEVIAGLNIYNILEPCYHSKKNQSDPRRPEDSRAPQSFKDLGVTDKPLPIRTRMLGRAWPLRAPVRDGRVPSWQELASAVPCMVSSIGPWLLCTAKLDFFHDAGSMITYHKNLTSQGYRALIYRYTQGAGHTVPEYKPQEALAFYTRWLAGSKL
ncbi:hypothetical protein HU200_019893 [Digitaria exilis]|uniref:Uncharacterized protein n=1 Tax=Digitaria exilis TaxID=1010633 RepID=A0A835KDS9_9POAL|nr:hypothetical protein HU200_019893 [Digitaria exilis]